MKVGVLGWCVVMLGFVLPPVLWQGVHDAESASDYQLVVGDDGEASFMNTAPAAPQPSINPLRVGTGGQSLRVENPFGHNAKGVDITLLLRPELPLGSLFEIGLPTSEGTTGWRPVFSASAHQFAEQAAAGTWTGDQQVISIQDKSPVALDPFGPWRTFTADAPVVDPAPSSYADVKRLDLVSTPASFQPPSPDENRNGLRAYLQVWFLTGDTPGPLVLDYIDLNQDEGPDGASVVVTDSGGARSHLERIQDDGIRDRSREISIGSLHVDVDFDPWTWYRMTVSPASFDFGLRSLRSPGTTWFEDSVYLGGPSWGTSVATPVEIHLRSPGGPLEAFASAHEGLQDVRIEGRKGVRSLALIEQGVPVNLTLEPGQYRITLTSGSIRLGNANGLFSFTEDAAAILPPIASLDGGVLVRNAIRGNPIFWTFTEDGTISLRLTKQDLNWYDDDDGLYLSVTDALGQPVGSMLIEDDGTTTATGQRGPLQEGTLTLQGLAPGPYRISMAGTEDRLIRSIWINQPYFVAEKLFLVGLHPCCSSETGALDNSIRLTYGSLKPGSLSARAPHPTALQEIVMTAYRGQEEHTMNLMQANVRYTEPLSPGIWTVDVPTQDVLLDGPGYFSFSPETFFFPFVRERHDDPQAQLYIQTISPTEWASDWRDGYFLKTIHLSAATFAAAEGNQQLHISMRAQLPEGAVESESRVEIHFMSVQFTPKSLTERWFP